ncbi:MAG TPA: hypothetical protein VFV92_07470, partial [Candidatus Bathyarchaeia archaeon]|nr:hypothetical protein [Candidatus Bathyarchaeia archaeon]
MATKGDAGWWGLVIPRQAYQHVQLAGEHRPKHPTRVNAAFPDPYVPGFAAQAPPMSGNILPARAHRLYVPHNPP